MSFQKRIVIGFLILTISLISCDKGKKEFALIQDDPTVESLERFLANYPNHGLSIQAKMMRDSLVYSSIIHLNDVDTLKWFLNTYNTSKLLPRVKADLELLNHEIKMINKRDNLSTIELKIKELYGDRLSFWGTIDVQHTISFGSKEDVKKETIDRLKNVAPGGGLILGSTHNVQYSEVAIDNILTFYETVNKFGKYPIKILDYVEEG